jgi:GT2 family glycosyltransferase
MTNEKPPNTDAQVVVVILTLNQRETTLRCLTSLRQVREPAYQTLLWDNGSQDGTAESVRATFPEVYVQHHPANLGVAGGRNAAARLATELFAPTHLLFLDNDIEVEPGFIAELLKPFAEVPGLGQTQAKLRFLRDRQRLNDAGGARVNFLFGAVKPVGYGEVDRGQYDTPRDCISCGGAMMIRADLFRQLGGFDLRFNPFGPEDLDLSLRLVKAGYRALYVPSAVGYHEVGHTFGRGYTADYARHKARLMSIFVLRHAPLPQRIGFVALGAPYMAARAVLREARRGNFGALGGLALGLLDLLRKPGRVGNVSRTGTPAP